MPNASPRCAGSPVRRTLMCKNVEVATFTYDPRKRVVTGKKSLLNPEFLPVGCHGHDGRFSATDLGTWITARGIPLSRPGLSPVLASLALATPEELEISSLGLSLSDHYWFRPSTRPVSTGPKSTSSKTRSRRAWAKRWPLTTPTRDRPPCTASRRTACW